VGSTVVVQHRGSMCQEAVTVLQLVFSIDRQSLQHQVQGIASTLDYTQIEHWYVQVTVQWAQHQQHRLYTVCGMAARSRM
jgi:hypothetical protein